MHYLTTVKIYVSVTEPSDAVKRRNG